MTRTAVAIIPRAGPPARGVALLGMQGISKQFDGVQALQDAHFSVAAGEVHALLGENGAGKSTLIKIVCGALRRDTGSIRWGGEPVESEAGRRHHRGHPSHPSAPEHDRSPERS